MSSGGTTGGGDNCQAERAAYEAALAQYEAAVAAEAAALAQKTAATQIWEAAKQFTLDSLAIKDAAYSILHACEQGG